MVNFPNIRLSFNIKFLTTSNKILSALRRARKLINNIVKPHPSIEVPRSYTSSRRPLVVSPIMKILPTMPSEGGWEAANLSTPESDDLDSKSGQLDALSADSMQHISSPDNQHRGGVVGTAGRVNTLRRTKGNIRSIKHGHQTAISLSPSQQNPHHAVENHTHSPSPRSGPKPLTPILEQGDSSELVTDLVSPSDSADSVLVDSADSAIFFIDEDSGALFRVRHASGAFTSAEQLVLERSSLTSSLSLRIGSPPASAATSLEAHVESLPSFVLTLPTPASPHSPIFSPGVHFTTEKFLSAAEAASPRDRAPTLPRCDHVQGQGQGHVEGKEGKLCRACEMQLLACRVWFQNADGGARAALHEPFVRPAQSTVRTRAVLASLGVGAQSPSGVGLGIADGRDESESVRDDYDHEDEDEDEDIGDPGSLAIEAPPAASSTLAPISWSRVVLGKLRRRFKSLSLSMSTIRGGDRRRKCRHV